MQGLTSIAIRRFLPEAQMRTNPKKEPRTRKFLCVQLAAGDEEWS
ncbi:hypothetical protein OIU78_026509 [Salix suchowensis]|nr:hypothetical protein OIU78_026509 [Salix suchowensis]